MLSIGEIIRSPFERIAGIPYPTRAAKIEELACNSYATDADVDAELIIMREKWKQELLAYNGLRKVKGE
ncbi:MAG: hypothetical protein U0451_02345 [Candidatus Saccharimonadales bacterium]